MRNAFIALACLVTPALAQQTVNMPDVVELSGPGAVSGTNWRDGVILAEDEINAKGGILGRRIVTTHSDTQSNPGISRAQVQKALDGDPYVILGPIFSGSVKVNMVLAQQAEVPQFTGAEAADITQQGNPYIFRTSFGQQASMPKIANYIRDGVKAKSVAIVWVNNDFGKGGRDNFVREMGSRGIRVVADVSTETGADAYFDAALERFGRVENAVRLSRYGGDCYAYCMLAAGQIDLIIETELKPHDVVALIPIIAGAGGVITTWENEPAQRGGRIVAAGDKRVHAAALEMLNRG